MQDLTLRGYREIPIIIDPSAASFKTALRRERYKTKNADNDVIDGVREVSTLMGEGMLKVSTECENLINEIHLYSWDQRKQEKGIDMPLKENDHALDALRYGCMYFKNKSKGIKSINLGW